VGIIYFVFEVKKSFEYTFDVRKEGKHNLKLYHINPDYAVLYSSGGSTSQNLFTPTSNITIGIFTGMAGKVLELSVTK
jgi:hypothetical protein